MLAVISLLTVTLGATMAAVAGRFPEYIELLETGAGVLLIGGLALLGSTLPVML